MGERWPTRLKPCSKRNDFRSSNIRSLGPIGQTASVSYVVHPGSVAILPLVDDDHLCLIRNRRLTVGQTIIEVPAGTREPGEPPLETARRELEEETGYRAAKWEELVEFYASPGILSERMYVYVARDLTPGEPRREANEEIENLVRLLGRGPGDDRPRRNRRRQDDHRPADCTIAAAKSAQ